MAEVSFQVRDFAFAADDGYAIPLRVAVGSLLNVCSKNGGELVVHVLDLGVSDVNWTACVDSWKCVMPEAAFVRHPIDPARYAGLRLWRGSVATYARIDLPKLLPDVTWCYYFDCDTMVIEDPRLCSKWCDLDLALVGRAIRGDIVDAIDGKWLNEKGLPFDRSHYVCAGVLLMNLAWLRSHNAIAACFDFLSRYPDSVTPDQLALNCVCRGHVGLLPDEWGLGSDETMKSERCACVHFAGVVPWRKETDIGFFCGEHELAGIWRRLAVEKLNVPAEKLCNLSWRKTWFLRMAGFLVRQVLTIVVWTRLYPKRFGRIAESVRQRNRVQAVKRIRAQVFASDYQ